jgi:hypothetical protein
LRPRGAFHGVEPVINVDPKFVDEISAAGGRWRCRGCIYFDEFRNIFADKFILKLVT